MTAEQSVWINTNLGITSERTLTDQNTTSFTRLNDGAKLPFGWQHRRGTY